MDTTVRDSNFYTGQPLILQNYNDKQTGDQFKIGNSVMNSDLHSFMSDQQKHNESKHPSTQNTRLPNYYTNGKISGFQ